MSYFSKFTSIGIWHVGFSKYRIFSFCEKVARFQKIFSERRIRVRPASKEIVKVSAKWTTSPFVGKNAATTRCALSSRKPVGDPF